MATVSSYDNWSSITECDRCFSVYYCANESCSAQPTYCGVSAPDESVRSLRLAQESEDVGADFSLGVDDFAAEFFLASDDIEAKLSLGCHGEFYIYFVVLCISRISQRSFTSCYKNKLRNIGVVLQSSVHQLSNAIIRLPGVMGEALNAQLLLLLLLFKIDGWLSQTNLVINDNLTAHWHMCRC